MIVPRTPKRLASISAIAAGTAAWAQPVAADREPILRPFDYRDVTLTGGPLEAQAAAARAFFLALDEDNLLHGFRTRDGGKAPGRPMGGWYDPQDFAGAHPFGQFVSALARYYANTGDAAFRDKVDRLVAGFADSIRADGFFYSSQKAFDDWGCYIYDKNCVGMRDAYTLAGCEQALEVLGRMTDWAVPHLDRRNDEWYTLAENLYRCYALTGEQRYLELAREFDAGEYYWNDLALGQNALHTDRHAYSHVNSLLSACQAFESTGEMRYLSAARQGWALVAETQMFASGGWGPTERFLAPGDGARATSLGSTHDHFETVCGSYAHVNLDRWLLCHTAHGGYGDHMERILFNGMLGALPMQSDGRAFYYSDYSPGAQKGYFPSLWPCCAGTHAQITADYPLDIYFRSEDSLTVNLYTPSRVVWKRATGEVHAEQQTAFPLDDRVVITLCAEKPQEFTLRLRVPAWAGDAVEVRLEGEQIPLPQPERGFLPLHRRWGERTVIELRLPMTLRWEPIAPETPELAALMYGPLMLVALADGEVTFTRGSDRAESWIRPAGEGPAEFRAEPEGIRFRPFFAVTDERYTTYCRLSRGSDARDP